jgi:hypothetical protein
MKTEEEIENKEDRSPGLLNQVPNAQKEATRIYKRPANGSKRNVSSPRVCC